MFNLFIYVKAEHYHILLPNVICCLYNNNKMLELSEVSNQELITIIHTTYIKCRDNRICPAAANQFSEESHFADIDA